MATNADIQWKWRQIRISAVSYVGPSFVDKVSSDVGAISPVVIRVDVTSAVDSGDSPVRG